MSDFKIKLRKYGIYALFSFFFFLFFHNHSPSVCEVLKGQSQEVRNLDQLIHIKLRKNSVFGNWLSFKLEILQGHPSLLTRQWSDHYQNQCQEVHTVSWRVEAGIAQSNISRWKVQVKPFILIRFRVAIWRIWNQQPSWIESRFPSWQMIPLHSCKQKENPSYGLNITTTVLFQAWFWH